MKIVILGAGLVGGPMARDLAADEGLSVVVADRSAAALARLGGNHGITAVQEDLSRPAAVKRVVRDADLVVNAVPGAMGFAALRAVLEAGRHVVDIAFFPEDPFALDTLAKERGLIAIVDCGVAPGLSHILAAHGVRQLDQARSVLIYVGGLPVIREWPFEYKAVFSPYDVIEEYLRPARIVENGRVIMRPALSDPERLSFPGVGTLEAFNTDGLRTLAHTLRVPEMKEKTLRYPGHIEKMAVLRETGFFDTREIAIGGTHLRPIDFTAALLFPKWKLGEGEEDITVLKVIVEGTRAGKERRIVYDLIDRHDGRTGIHSMARTTGYTATAAARMVLRGLYTRKGISAPEFIARSRRCVDFITRTLAARGVVYTESLS